MQKKKNWIKIIIFVCIVTGILMLNHHYGWSSYLGDMSNLMFLKTMVEENIVAALALYIIITIVGCVVLALPGVTFAVIAGIANVNHFFTLLGKMFFTPYGKEFFTSLSKQIFTS